MIYIRKWNLSFLVSFYTFLYSISLNHPRLFLSSPFSIFHEDSKNMRDFSIRISRTELQEEERDNDFILIKFSLICAIFNFFFCASSCKQVFLIRERENTFPKICFSSLENRYRCFPINKDESRGRRVCRRTGAFQSADSH